MSAEELIAFWDRCDLDQAPYVHPDDQEILLAGRYSDKLICAPLNSPDEWIAPGRQNHVHLGLLPTPYIGDIRSADIIVCLINPGYAPADYFGELRVQEYRKAVISNLQQHNKNSDYPFFSLNPNLCWSSGHIWWMKKLQEVILKFSENCFSGDFDAALKETSKRIAAVELFPYHSKSFSFGGLLGKLPSTKAAQKFVLGRACLNDALIVVTRQTAKWGVKETPNCIVYGPRQARGASLSLKSEGGKAILQRLNDGPVQ